MKNLKGWLCLPELVGARPMAQEFRRYSLERTKTASVEGRPPASPG
jgi:hypothetical protein